MGENATSQRKDGQDDLAILFPDRSPTIAGVALTMREYRFVESLEHHALIARFTDAITGLALQGDFADLDSLRSTFGEFRDEVVDLIALSCDQPAEWVGSLDAVDGEQLMMVWWTVNAPFFLRRVLLSVGLRKARELPGATSSPSSSPTGTAPTTSAGTPTDS